MQPRHCAGCGAPLPDSSSDAASDTVTCRFCGLVHDRARAARVSVRVNGRPSPAGLIGSVGLVVALVAVILGVAVAMLVWSGRLASTVTRGVATAVAPPASSSDRRRQADVLTVSELASLSPGRHTLTAAAPAGGYGALDAMAQLPWALAIAQSWAADARLERIDVTRVRPDGTVNAADDVEAAVRYRFASPHAAKVLMARRQTSTRARATTALWIEVARGRLVVVAVENGGERHADAELAAHPTGLSLTTLVPRLQQRRPYRVPFLEGYLVHLDDEGWVWYLSPLSGESLPRVRAADGEPWPYRRSRR